MIMFYPPGLFLLLGLVLVLLQGHTASSAAAWLSHGQQQHRRPAAAARRSCLLVPPPRSSSSAAASLSSATGDASQQGGTEEPTSSPAAAAAVPSASPAAASTTDYDLDFDWEEVAAAVFEEDDSPILLFDGICNFCNGGVNVCLDLDNAQVFRFASLQSRVGQALLIRSGKRPDDWSSLVLVTPDADDGAYFESQAVLRVAERLGGLPKWMQRGSTVLRRVVPKLLLDAAYKVVARNRHLLGETTECRIDWDGSLQKRFVPDPETPLRLECVTDPETPLRLECTTPKEAEAEEA